MKKGKEILIVTHSYLPDDPRVRKELLALSEAGYSGDVLCLKYADQPFVDNFYTWTLYRIPISRHRGSGILIYFLEYLSFFVFAFWFVTYLWLKRKYKIIQVHTLPDFLIFSALVPKLFGTKVILDMHELSPDFFATRYNLGRANLLVRFVTFIERVSCAFADKIITIHQPAKEILSLRGAPEKKITIIMNTSESNDLDDDYLRIRNKNGKFIFVYHGLLSDLYDLPTVIKAVKMFNDKGLKDIILRIVGDGPEIYRLINFVKQLNLSEQVIFEGKIIYDKVRDILLHSHVGVIPLANKEYLHLALPTKLFECISFGLPVIITRMRTVEYYFSDDSVFFVKPENVEDMYEKMHYLYANYEKTIGHVIRAKEILEKIEWGKMKLEYVSLIDSLIKTKRFR
jgi:glycosyltransferase involved in cell wall biosynthesis